MFRLSESPREVDFSGKMVSVGCMISTDLEARIDNTVVVIFTVKKPKKKREKRKKKERKRREKAERVI